MRRLRAMLLALGLVVGAGAVAVLATAPAADALSGSDFRAGNIISDAAFYDSGTMTAAQIQAFLNREYSGCNKGYVCIRDYTTKTTSQPAQSGLCSAYTGKASQTAASVIYSVAQACGVNPQSILVLLQKESGLITSWSPDYKTATGYGCPDNSGCAAKYYGFFNQVYLAAHQFKLYRLNPTNYSFVAGRSNYIQYDVSTKCGGSNVVIENQATAGLYDYTPYQPNAASLAAMPGTGNSCSSYGNRNFWYYFTTWFGTPPTPYGAGGVLATTSAGALYYWPNGYGVGPGDPYHDPVEVAASGWQGLKIAVGDFTGDGLADVMVTRPDGSLWLYTNNGTVNPYGKPVEIRDTGFKSAVQLIAVDANGDGLADLFVQRTNGSVYYYRNTGNAARLLAPATIPYPSGWNVYSDVVGGDVDGDGLGDLLAAKPDGSLWLYRGLGTGSFTTPVEVRTSGFNAYSQLLMGDVNGDGLADLEGVKPNGQLWLFLNTPGRANPFPSGTVIGTGWKPYGNVSSTTVSAPHRTTSAAVVVRKPADGGSLYTYADVPQRPVFGAPQQLGASWAGYASVVVGDFDGSGRAGVLGIQADGSRWLAANTGASATLADPVRVPGLFKGYLLVVAGDVTGDGLADLIGRRANGSLWLASNTTTRGSPVSFAAPVEISTANWNGYDRLALVDLDGDGRADLVATQPNGAMVRFHNTGKTTQLFASMSGKALTGWGSSTGLAGGDVDGSGYGELVTAHGATITLDADGGADRFPRLIPVGTASGVTVAALYLADMTGGPADDLVVLAKDGSLWLMPNLGTANQPYPTRSSAGGSAWNGYTVMAAGDFTADGRTDLIATRLHGSLWLRPNNGTATPYSSATELSDSGWTSTTALAAGDVNGDGRADLVALQSNGTLQYYPETGTSTVAFGNPVQIDGSGWAGRTVLLADVTGDGLADLIVRDTSGVLWLYPNTHDPSAPFVHRVKIGQGFGGYTALAAADVDGDGRADLLARDSSGALWYFRNTGNPSAPFAGRVLMQVKSWGGYDVLVA